MRILLDESLPRDLADVLSRHDVSTVQAVGWSGVENGTLLALAAASLDVFVTADRNLVQQNLSLLPIAVVVLSVRRNRIQEIEPLVPAVLDPFKTLAPRTLAKIGS